MPTKILFVDDNRMLRDSMKEIIEHIKGTEVIGTASNEREAVEFVKKAKPDVIVMDINMPIMDGIEATSRITAEHSGIGIIGFSMSGERWKVQDSLKAGGKGYLLKITSLEELAIAINTVQRGGTYFTEEVQGHFGH